MTDKQNAKLTMYQIVYDTCAENAAVYAQVEAFAAGVNDLNADIARIREIEQQRLDVKSNGVTKEKTALKEALVEAALKIASALYAYGFKTENPDIMAKVNFSRSVLLRMEDNALTTTAGEIAAVATASVAELTPYGINANDVDELKAKTAAYEAIIAKPRVAIGEHRVATANLAQTFRQTDMLLTDNLDKLIVLFEKSNPDFYNNYRNARNIINTSTRKRKPEEKKLNKMEE
jgi:hypothetical protein